MTITGLTDVTRAITLLRGRILTECRADSCIITCKAAQALLRTYGIETKPLTVAATVFNDRWRVAQEAGVDPMSAPEAYSIGIGVNEGVVRHLVLYNTDFLIDGSLDQARRPLLPVEPAVFPMDAEHYANLLAGERVSYVSPTLNVGVSYRAFPHNRGYTTSPNWGNECRTIVARMVGDTRRVLDRLP